MTQQLPDKPAPEPSEDQQQARPATPKSDKPPKDAWDKIGALAPIISGLLISVMAGYFTYSYNQQQLRLQEIQTIEKFIPHLLGNEKSKKAAILAISSLTNTKLAARFASLFASEGTVSALKSIATTGDTKDRTIATEALEKALETVAERYNFENRYSEAEQAYQEALELKEQSLGPNHPDIPRTLDKLAELYKANGKYEPAIALLKRSLNTKEKLYGPEDPTVATTLKSLADLYRLQGRYAEAEPLAKRALAIDEQVIQAGAGGTATDAMAAVAQPAAAKESPAPPPAVAPEGDQARTPASEQEASPDGSTAEM
ncbi:MAG TPA: tetratricopeptide repeat protein [Candidatus Obscuribacterales bacterium]